MRSRWLFVSLLLAVVAFGLPSPVAAQSEADVKALTDKIEALERRIDLLERNLTQQMSRISQQLAQGAAPGAAAPNAAEETAAQTALAEVNRLMNAGDTTQAKAKMTDFMRQYGSTRVAAGARSTYQELQVIGKEVPADWGIEKWFQGEKEANLGGKGTKLVVFWETWCPHCQREVPKLEAMYEKLKGDGLGMVGLTKITKSSTEEKVTEFLTSRHVTYPVAKESGVASQHFGVSGIPAAVVVKDGVVVWRGHPARLSEAQIKAWL